MALGMHYLITTKIADLLWSARGRGRGDEIFARAGYCSWKLYVSPICLFLNKLIKSSAYSERGVCGLIFTKYID